MIKEINKYLLGILLLFSFSCNSVIALENDEIFYENPNGVSLTKEEYDFIGEFYYDGFQECITLDNYLRLKSNNIMTRKITKVEIGSENNGINPLSYDEVSYQSASKKLVMSYACDTKSCDLTLIATWLTVANVRSYDLIGAYSPTSNALEYVLSYMDYSGGTSSPVYTNKASNGISATFKLPTTDAKYIFVMEFTAPVGTKVYGSYQHAKKSITLANSKKYSFASSGYGGVFRFDASVSSYYDAMGGVKVSL